MSTYCETAFLQDTRKWLVVSSHNDSSHFCSLTMFRSIFRVVSSSYPGLLRREVTKITIATANQVCNRLNDTAKKQHSAVFSSNLIGDYIAECLFNEQLYLAAKLFILKHFSIE